MFTTPTASPLLASKRLGRPKQFSSEEISQHKSVYQKERIASARAGGICTRCFCSPAAPDRRTCSSCLEIRQRSIRSRSAQRFKEGTCVFCNKAPRVGEAVHCQNCRARNNQRIREAKARLRQDIFDAYGWSCACCGETEEAFLQLDHVKDDGAQHRRRVKGTNVYHELRQRGFPSGFQTLCSNCNWAKRRGDCPHQTKKSIAEFGLLQRRTGES